MYIHTHPYIYICVKFGENNEICEIEYTIKKRRAYIGCVCVDLNLHQVMYILCMNCFTNTRHASGIQIL